MKATTIELGKARGHLLVGSVGDVGPVFITPSEDGPIFLTINEARELALFLKRHADSLEPRPLGIGKGVSGFVTHDATRAALEAFDEAWQAEPEYNPRRTSQLSTSIPGPSGAHDVDTID